MGVICDGCTDSSIEEQEIVYIRTCVRGDIDTSFLAVNAPQRADADGILSIVTQALDSTETNWKYKLVGFGSDGANVMMGKNNGVVAKLKTMQPSLQGVHCSSHRLELAFKECAKKVATFQRMNTLLTGLYLFYHNSPLNRNNLKTSFEASQLSPLMPTKVGGTRWLPHLETAFNNLWGGYRAIISHLENLQEQRGASADAVGKSKGFLRMLKDPVLV